MKRLEPYEKPEIEYWPAQELDAIVATMSGGSGGGYVPADSSKPYNYKSTALGVGIGWSWASVSTVNQYWFVIDDSGVHDIEVNVSRSCELYVFSEGGTSSIVAFDGAAASGTKSLTVETTYLNRTFVCVTPSAQTTIKVRAKRHIRTIAASSIGSGGVEWAPSNPMYRPDESPVCQFRWYISRNYVEIVMDAFSIDFFYTFEEAAAEGLLSLVEEMTKAFSKSAIEVNPLAKVFMVICEVLGTLSLQVVSSGLGSCACNSSGTPISGALFILEQNISGDATVQTPLYSFQSWNGTSAEGAAGYDAGTITAFN
ncbi:MAG: hypothetical protein ACI36Y_09560 [Coriobacteriales bacterium]